MFRYEIQIKAEYAALNGVDNLKNGTKSGLFDVFFKQAVKAIVCLGGWSDNLYQTVICFSFWSYEQPT